jgi:hypothetical protein
MPSYRPVIGPAHLPVPSFMVRSKTSFTVALSRALPGIACRHQERRSVLSSIRALVR